MQIGPGEARSYAAEFRKRFTPASDRETWFFPPAVSLEAASAAFRGLDNTQTGAQDIYWEAKGAFTGAVSAGLAKAAGAGVVLIGTRSGRTFSASPRPTRQRRSAPPCASSSGQCFASEKSSRNARQGRPTLS